GCHLSSPDGKRKLGTQLKVFFDSLNQVQQTIEPKSTLVEEKSETSVLPEIEEPEFEQPWQARVDAALSKSVCPPIEKINYPDDYYQGKLTDTHLHIPSIPDWSADDEPTSDEIEGRFGGPGAFLGWNVKMSEIACTIQHEGTTKNFAFFPVYEDIPEEQLYIWKETMSMYPELFTPFIMSSGNDGDPDGFPTVDAKTLKSMLAVYPGLFEGYGEIGLYERENGGSPELPPDSQRLQEIYPIVKQNKLAVYFHLGDGHKDNFERILKANPDTNFVWHGDQLSIAEIEDILTKHPNAHYGLEIIGEGSKFGIFPLFVGKSKQAYIDAVEQKFDSLLSYDIKTWKPVIERHPNQLVWGTDRADAEWNYDIDVGQLMVKYARAFIGQLDPSVQEKFAYKNAERLVK
ncbi:amidohydrolase family protein, partial [Candidatus Woesearchaeota archaeon]|nr:amidohydrolase family protein [Candidatus Woesearchaeota archaeon]